MGPGQRREEAYGAHRKSCCPGLPSLGLKGCVLGDLGGWSFSANATLDSAFVHAPQMHV